MTNKKLHDIMQGVKVLRERERQHPTITVKIDRKTLLSIDTIKHLYHLHSRGEAIVKVVQDMMRTNHLDKSNKIYKKLMGKE